MGLAAEATRVAATGGGGCGGGGRVALVVEVVEVRGHLGGELDRNLGGLRVLENLRLVSVAPCCHCGVFVYLSMLKVILDGSQGKRSFGTK